MGAQVLPMHLLSRKLHSKIIKTKEEGNSVVVVVSAMGSRTDDLINLAVELTDNPAPREMDMLLSTGERRPCL